MKMRTKKLLSVLLTLVMVLGLLPAGLVTTAKADWIDPDNFAVCQFCGYIYDNSEEGCSSCGLHEPCIEENLDEEEVQLHYENCVAEDLVYCEECGELVEVICDCGWHGDLEDGHSAKGVDFLEHFIMCVAGGFETDKWECEVCGMDAMEDPILFQDEWCSSCGCHLVCFDELEWAYMSYEEHGIHAEGCLGLSSCYDCEMFVEEDKCGECGYHADGDCVPREQHEQECLGWVFCEECMECHDPEEVAICEDCWRCEEYWEECPACGAPCNCQCVDDYCEECNVCPFSDPPECDSCGEDVHDMFHECEETRCPDCDMCDAGKEQYYGTLECEVENCDNNGNCPCQCGHFGDDFDPEAVDLSTRYDFHVTVTNGERALGNVPVYYQYKEKSYFLGFTGPDGVAEGYTTIMDGGAPGGWTVSAGRGGLNKTGGALYKTAGPENVEYAIRPMEWRDIYDVSADMVMERYTVEGVADNGKWDLYVIPHLTTDTSYENISWLTQTKLDKQIEKVKNMAENGIGYGGADSNVELHMANNYGVYLYPLDSSGTLSTMEAPWYRSANQLTGQEAPGLIWYIPDVPYGEYLAIVYLPGYKPYATAYTHYPAQEMSDVRPCELYAYMSTSTSASTTSRMQQVAIRKAFDVIGQTGNQTLPEMLFIHLVNDQNGRSTWAVTEPDQLDVFYFKPTSSSGDATYTVNIYGRQDHWYLETTYDGNSELQPYEAVKYTDDTELNTDLAPGITFYAEGKPLRSGQKVSFTLESTDGSYAVNITSPQVLGLYDGRLRYNAGKGYTYVADGAGETVYLCNFSNDGYYNSGFGLQGSWKLTASLKGYNDYETTLTAEDMEAMTAANGIPLKINFSTEENGTGVFFSRKLPSTAEPYIIGRDDKSDWTYTVQADGYVQNAANTYQMRLNEWYRSPTEAPGAWHNITTSNPKSIGVDGEYTVELPFSRGGGEYRYQVDFYINNKKVASSNVLSVQATASLGDCDDMTMKGLDITSYTNATKEYVSNDTLFLLPGQSTTVALKFGERDIKKLVFREEGTYWELFGSPDNSFAEVVSSDNYSATIRANEPGAGTLNVCADTLGDERYDGASTEFYVTVPVNEFKVTMPEPEVGKLVSQCQATPAPGCEGWYNVETIWYKGSSITNGTVMASTDTFAGQQEYTVKVVFKEVEQYSDYSFYAQGRNDGAINGETCQAYGPRDDYFNFLSDEVYLTKTYAGMHDNNGIYVDAVDINIPVPEAGMTLNDLKEQITISSYYNNVTLKSIGVLSPSGVYNSTLLIAQKRYDLMLELEAHDVNDHDSFFTVGGTAIVNGVSDTYFTSEATKNEAGEPYTTCLIYTTIFCGGESDVIPIEALFLVPEKHVLKVGESTKINVYAYPENHTDTIEWSKESYCASYFDWDEETCTLTAKGTPRVPSYILYAKTVYGNADVKCIIELTDGSDALYSFTAKDTRVNTDGYYLEDTSTRGSTVCIYPDYTKVPEGHILTGYTITDDDGAVVDIKVKDSGGIFYDTYYWLYMPARNITATPIYTPTESGNVSGTIYSNGVLADMIQTTLTNTSTGKVRKLSLTGENGKAFEFKNVEAGTYQLEVTKAGHKDYLAYLDVNGDQERSITLYQLVPQALITIGGTMSGGTANVTVEGLADGVSATIIVGQYSGGKLLDAQTQIITGPGNYSVSGFASVSGATYKVFLVNRGGAPLCEAKPLV